jgi:hypothetical protein
LKSVPKRAAVPATEHRLDLALAMLLGGQGSD